MKRLYAIACVFAAAAILIPLLQMAGCEEGDPDRWLIITPSEVVLKGGTISVTFTAAPATNAAVTFSTPLEWRMSSPQRGSFVGGSGNSIIYVRAAEKGLNVITAKDPYGAEGSAIVHQR